MGFLQFISHLLNFVLPAAAVAVLLALFSRVIWRKNANVSVKWSYIAINFIVCVTCLAAGLVYFGNDAKMATYGLMLLAAATVQWLQMKAWKR